MSPRSVTRCHRSLTDPSLEMSPIRDPSRDVTDPSRRCHEMSPTCHEASRGVPRRHKASTRVNTSTNYCFPDQSQSASHWVEGGGGWSARAQRHARSSTAVPCGILPATSRSTKYRYTVATAVAISSSATRSHVRVDLAAGWLDAGYGQKFLPGATRTGWLAAGWLAG